MTRPGWAPHAAVCVAYGVAAYAFIAHGASLTQQIYGVGSDPSLEMWFLAWWPYALGHHLYPLYTDIIWQPHGLNLAWTTCIPLLALLAAPVTLLGGPVLSFNLLTLAAPVLAALAAYALCLYLTRQILPACLGGYLFGFSAYEMAQSTDHLNLDFAAFIPLLVLLTLARLDGRLSRQAALAAAVLLLAAQFLTSLELFATAMMFGAITFALAWWCAPPRRAALRRLALDGLCASPLLLLLLSPMLWALFALPRDIALPVHWPHLFSTDILNLILPTATTLAGAGLAQPVTAHFPGFLDEQDGYLGVPLLVIIYLYGRQHGQLLPLLLGIITLLSLGPSLWIGGVPSGVPLPWALLDHLPFIGNALPARFMLYAALLAAIIAALWMAAAPAGRPRRLRLLCGGLAAITLVPPPHQVQDVPYLAFFAPGASAAALGPQPKLLILPFGILGPSSYWQAESQFSFAQTGGYLGFPPAAMQADGPMMRFYFGLDTPGFPADFARFCTRTGTQYVVAAPHTPPHTLALIESLGWPARPVDDVLVFTVPHG